MKAVMLTGAGGTEMLKLLEVPDPELKGPLDVLVRLHAGGLNPVDYKTRAGMLRVIRRYPLPCVMGNELAGVVVETGAGGSRFQRGDRVMVRVPKEEMGAFAEYACTSENRLALKPANVTFEQAAAIPVAGVTALQGLRDKGRIQPGQNVLINGAAGGVGTFAVQIAKSFGAEVTGVCSTPNLEMVRSIGSDHVVDYTQEDFTQNGETYDVIFDAPGKSSFSRSQRSLRPEGQYLSANPGMPEMLRIMRNMITRPRRAMPEYTSSRNDDLVSLRELIEAGKIKPVIDRRYPLEQTAEAHRYVEAGHKKGNVVIVVG